MDEIGLSQDRSGEQAAAQRGPRRPDPGARWRRLALLAALALFTGAAVISMLGPSMQARALPDREAIDRCAARLAERVAPEDGVRIHPTWYGDHRRALLGALEDRSAAPFDWFDEREPPDEIHDRRYARIWVVHLPLVGAAPVERLFPEDHAVESREACGHGLELVVVRPPAATIRFDLLREISGASVSRAVPGERPVTCHWEDTKFDCHGATWRDVMPLTKDVGGSRRRCVYVEPAPHRATVTLRFPGLLLGARTVVSAGFSIEGARRTNGDDVRFEISLAGHTVVDHTEPKLAYRWNRFDLDTRAVMGAPTDLELRVSTPTAGWRQFCIDALSFDDEP